MGPDRLTVRIRADRTRRLEFPRTGADPRLRAALLPQSEGLRVPLHDPFWLRAAAGECHDTHGQQLPFWGFETADSTFTVLLAHDLRTQVCLAAPGVAARHDFEERDGLPVYEVRFLVTPRSLLAPALAYRETLTRVTLTEKIRATPQAARLAGAMHAYLWGDGLTRAFIEQLRSSGSGAWNLVYDGAAPPAEVAQAATAAGFLFGPYDSLNNIQDPRRADAPNAVFDEALWRAGGVLRRDGTRHPGFGGRGYHLSSEALRRAPRPFLSERLQAARARGANAYFLDVDATGELYDDFDPRHPMTLARDRDNRIERMRAIVAPGGFVLGSESAAAWSVPYLHYTHGPLTPKFNALWSFLRDRAAFGRWWPPERPSRMFRPSRAPEDLARLAFDPTVRVPLYEAVFHDAVVATDFWELSLPKLPALARQRALLLMLYGVPPVWHLDTRAWKEHRSAIDAFGRVFGPLHRAIFAAPLTSFEWLTPDGRVQRTRFGAAATLTANFGPHAWQDLPPGCLDAGRFGRYCPEF